MDQIGAHQAKLPKKQRHSVGKLLQRISLSRVTYYDERKRIANPYDKYAQVKQRVLAISRQGLYRGRRTYGYRRVKALLDQDGIHLADATATRIMRQLGVQVSMYNQHRNGKYSSYRGTVRKIAQNVLQQSFTATKPYQVIHIDITQI